MWQFFGLLLSGFLVAMIYLFFLIPLGSPVWVPQIVALFVIIVARKFAFASAVSAIMIVGVLMDVLMFAPVGYYVVVLVSIAVGSKIVAQVTLRNSMIEKWVILPIVFAIGAGVLAVAMENFHWVSVVITGILGGGITAVSFGNSQHKLPITLHM